MATIIRASFRYYSNSVKKYDAVVVGGGHNGLVAAAYLQKSGYQVCVLEQRCIVGGAAVTEEIVDGFKFSRASYVLSLLRPQIVEDLKLKEFGFRVKSRDPSSYTPLRSNLWNGPVKSLTLGVDGNLNVNQIAQFSTADAQVYPQYEALLGRLASAIEPLLDVSPAQLMSISNFGHILRDRNLLTAAWRVLNLRADCIALYELLTAPPIRILQRWFESQVLIATLAMDAVIGTMQSPHSSGTGYILLLHSMMGQCSGGRGRWGYPLGGMGGVSQAIAASAQALGVDIFTNQTVSQILLDGTGAACGVRTSDGAEFASSIVLSNATPKVTFLDLLPQGSLNPRFESAVRAIDYSSGVTKINVAVNKLPNFLANPNNSWAPERTLPHHQATIHINSEQVACLEDAHRDVLQGNCSKRPLIEMVIPSVVDPTIAPDRAHVVLLFTQYTPYNHVSGVWDDAAKESYASSVFSLIDEYAPGFTDSVVGKEVLTPPDLEKIFGLTGGNIFHGAMSPDNLFMLRPHGVVGSPTTPIPRLLLCGSGAHPGGGVSGAPGRIAAREAANIFAQLKLRKAL